MTSITPFKSYTVGLFKGAGGSQLQALQSKSTALPAQPKLPPVQSAPPVVTQGEARGVGDEPQWVRDGRDSLAKAEAAFAAREAKEQQFEQENGFRRKVNEGALGAYAKAQSGNFAVPSFGTADEAAAYLEYLVSSMRSNASIIKSSSFEAQSLGKPEVAAFYGDVKTGQLSAMYADSQKAAEMDLFVLKAVLSKTFSTSGPTYSQEGGKVSFVAQDFAFGGKAIARLSEDGFLTRLGADGQPAGVDRRV